MSTRMKSVTLKWVRKQIDFTCDKPYPKPEKLSAEKDCESSPKKGEEREWTQCSTFSEFHCTPWTSKFSCTENWKNWIVWIPGVASGKDTFLQAAWLLSIGKSAELRLLLQEGGRGRVQFYCPPIFSMLFEGLVSAPGHIELWRNWLRHQISRRLWVPKQASKQTNKK